MFSFSLATTVLALTAFVSVQSPTRMCLLLIVASLGCGAFLWQASMKWACFAIVLIFLGGMMVVFVYVSTLSSNDKLTTSKGQLFTLLPAILVASTMTSLPPTYSVSMPELFHSTGYLIILFLVAFLLLTLTIVVKTTQAFKGALMKSFK